MRPTSSILPSRRAGIDTVIVNGEIVWRDGRATGKRPGSVLRNRRGTVE